MDKQPIEVDRLAGNIALKSIILSQDVMCEEGANDDDSVGGSKERCNWIGPLNSLHKHYISCQYKIIICNHCNHKETRSSMFLHKRQCQQRLITCKFCNKIGQYKHRNLHVAYCSHWKFLCENGCTAKVSRVAKKSHLDNDCPLSKVPCPYYIYGCDCDGYLLRKDLAIHLLDGNNLRLIIPGLLKRVEADTIKIGRLEDKLNDTKHSYVSLSIKVPYGSDMMNMISLTKLDDNIIITDLPRYLLPRLNNIATEYIATFVTEEWSVFEESGLMLNDIITRVENTKTGIIINITKDTTVDNINKAFEYTGKKCITLLMTIKRKLE